MKFKLILNTLFLVAVLTTFGQDSNLKKFKKLSCPEKYWVVWHPFVAKKALKISELTRKTTEEVKTQKQLQGIGNGDQVDAFRHTFWMAKLTQEIGWRRAKKLGKAHEKGNYKDYKKHRFEDGALPDKVSSDMDLYNNNAGIEIGKKSVAFELKNIVVETVLQGRCKIIKTDNSGGFLDCEGKLIPNETLKGKWENEKCLVESF